MPAETICAPVDFDIQTAGPITQRLRAAMDDGFDPVVLDLSQVGFMDSSGLQAVVRGVKHARRVGCRLELREPSPVVVQLIERTGLRPILEE